MSFLHLFLVIFSFSFSARALNRANKKSKRSPSRRVSGLAEERKLGTSGPPESWTGGLGFHSRGQFRTQRSPRSFIRSSFLSFLTRFKQPRLVERPSRRGGVSNGLSTRDDIEKPRGLNERLNKIGIRGRCGRKSRAPARTRVHLRISLSFGKLEYDCVLGYLPRNFELRLLIIKNMYKICGGDARSVSRLWRYVQGASKLYLIAVSYCDRN